MNLDKKMFFLPRRLCATHNKLYVQFDLSSVPKDMQWDAIDAIMLAAEHESAIGKVYT